jgi:hypothetical protein
LVGHVAVCTEPYRHHDQISSVAYGRNGANNRNNTASPAASAARAESPPGPSAYARSLTSSM